MTEKNALLMPGLQTEEGQKKFVDAEKRRTDADYQCYLLLQELGDILGFEDNGGLYNAIVSRTDDEDETEELLERIRETIEKREIANNDLVDAVAGR